MLRWYIAVFAVVGVVVPGPMAVTGRLNPFGVDASWLRVAWRAGPVGLVPFVLIGLWAVAVRWRRAAAVERAQLKWFFAAAAWMTVVVLVLVLPPDDGGAPAAVELTAGVLVATGFWSLPAAVVIAVTRYRLFDIDRVIGRTLAYALIAGAVGAVYVVTVVGLQTLLPVEGSDLAIAGSTLVAAATFGPVRRGSSRSSTGASTARGTRWRWSRARSPNGCAGRSTSRSSEESCAPRWGRRSNPPPSGSGCAPIPRRSRRRTSHRPTRERRPVRRTRADVRSAGVVHPDGHSRLARVISAQLRTVVNDTRSSTTVDVWIRG